MHVYRSNRLERLVDRLASLFSSSPLPAFEQESIVVQSKGMERWLSLELSRRLGVLANATFPFPRAFVEQCLSSTEQDAPTSLYSRESLRFAVAAALATSEGDDGLDEPRAYIGDDPSGVRRLELAQRIAYVFDQYAVYRPDLLLGWLRGEHDDWQSALWRRLVEQLGEGHIPGRAERFFSRWHEGKVDPALLPRRVVVFGISSLPPLYVRLMALISGAVEVHLFYLSPSEQWAAGSQDDRTLFGSLGKVARDFQRVLEDSADYIEPEGNLFVDPGASSMLSSLQSDVLSLRRRGAEPGCAPPIPISTDDRSVAVESAHSPMREVEILHDQLTAFFEADPTLEPHDVLVMMPDVDTYAPLVDAVFARQPDESGAIPYRIADRTLRAENAVADALLAAIDTISKRMKASEVLDLLEHEPIRRRFGLADSELGSAFRLVRKARIRWGIDAEHRHDLGQPADDENTWRFGLRRLLLGFAMPGGSLEPFAGAQPLPGVDGDTADLVGRIAELFETLVSLRGALAGRRSIREWTELLTERMNDIVAPADEELWAARDVVARLASVAGEAEAVGFSEPLELPAVSAVVRERFETERTSHAFASGGVTFCAMLPMRSVPFRVVCLLGMNDASYPRRQQAPSFDWLTLAPRTGDRSSRQEDRHLFLEALLSARDRFLVSFVGRGIQDGAPYPPSVVVTQLLDTVRASFVRDPWGERQLSLALPLPDATDGVARSVDIVTEHPLQAFSPRYFEAGSGLFSFSEIDLAGARALRQPASQGRAFQSAPLTDVGSLETLDVDALARFFENPARGLLTTRLGLRLDDRVEVTEDREPVSVNPLDAYEVGDLLLEMALAKGALPENGLEVARSFGVLPPGTPGRVDYKSLYIELDALTKKALPIAGQDELPSLDVLLELDATTVTGTLGGLYPTARLSARFARLKPKNEIAEWVRHLALQCSDAPSFSYPATTVLVGRSTTGGSCSVCVYPPLERSAARRHLERLIQLYRLGQRAPLAFFPQASRKFAELTAGTLEGADVDRALQAARRLFLSGRGSEAEDESVRRLFAGVDPFVTAPVPFDEEGALGLPNFAEAARIVFGPLLSHCIREES